MCREVRVKSKQTCVNDCNYEQWKKRKHFLEFELGTLRKRVVRCLICDTKMREREREVEEGGCAKSEV